jgi:UDP-N-acetyl-alpha-D-muramoyl-L-alanyl-L-glutamate epimerase
MGDSKTVEFNYELIHAGGTSSLTETLIFPEKLTLNNSVQQALRALHLALGISYYKIFLPSIIAQPYAMPSEEAAFWNDVFSNGLGEFLYVNKLNKSQVAKFSEQDGIEFNQAEQLTLSKKAILGIGGGKDSIVAGELLKKLGIEITCFVMATGEQLGQSKAVADVMKIPLLAVGRTLDPQLMNLQMQPGAYRGHVPISLIFGLVGTVLALSQSASYVVVANEASSSTPTVQWQGEAVNHQWSKSFNFEKSLQSYIKQNISEDLTYFSAIRPLTSIAIAKNFSQFSQYFEVFTSDNFVFRIDPSKRPNGRWSLESPKSLSSYILLAPWLSDVELTRIFSQNFLDEPSLEQLFLELTGVNGHPPLDCVGTVEELVLSLNLLAEKGRFADAYLMQVARKFLVIKSRAWDEELKTMLKPKLDQAFPPELLNQIQAELNK